MDELSKMQEGMERMGLMAASLYGAMTREGVPPEVAERLTAATLHKALEMGAAQQTKQQAQPVDLQAELLKLIRNGGRA